MLRNHNQAWQNWFDKVGIEPLEICYEELEDSPEATTIRVLKFLGLDLPEGVKLYAPNRRLADETNWQWKQRFETELQEST